jgi:hypothetical protein
VEEAPTSVRRRAVAGFAGVFRPRADRHLARGTTSIGQMDRYARGTNGGAFRIIAGPPNICRIRVLLEPDCKGADCAVPPYTERPIVRAVPRKVSLPIPRKQQAGVYHLIDIKPI